MSFIPIVIKIGGSLFDRPDLGARLRHWLPTLPTREILLVPGGGAAADLVRDLDRRHGLGEEKSHWLALRAVSLNAWFLASLLPQSSVVTEVEECPTCWRQGKIPILDGHAFAVADENWPDHLPHSWAVTSDSLAARAAVLAGARQLILLKSVSIPQGLSWAEAGQRGFVDASLAEVVAAVPDVTVSSFRFEDLPVASAGG